MTILIDSWQKINMQAPFFQQLDELLQVILQSKDLHQLVSYTHIINDCGDEAIARKLEQLQQMIEHGKKENILQKDLPDSLILGFIFQGIVIPNHTNISNEQFLGSIKQMICHSVFQKNNE